MTLIDELAAMSSESLSRMSNAALVEHLLAYKDRYETLSEEFDEYKSSSLEMEQMLEKELEDTTKARRGAEKERDGLRRELERQTVRADSDKREACAIEERLRAELAGTRAALEAAMARVRALEQANDDLERKDRNKEQMLEDLTRNFESAIERSTLLESEIAEMNFQAESATRIREEMRTERPRVAVVDPLRMEPPPPPPMPLLEHTPEDTPEAERKAFAAMRIDDSMEVDEVHPSTSSCLQQQEVGAAAVVGCSSQQVAPAVEEEKRRRPFTHSIHKIIQELLARVDHVENCLTMLKSGSSGGGGGSGSTATTPSAR